MRELIGIDVAVDLRVIGRFIGLQVAPCERRGDSYCGTEQRYHQNAAGGPPAPRVTAGSAVLALGPIGYLDLQVAVIRGVRLQSLQPVARIRAPRRSFRIEPHIQLTIRASSYFAIVKGPAKAVCAVFIA